MEGKEEERQRRGRRSASHVAEFKREQESRGTSRIRDVSGARVRSLREL